MSSWNLAGLGFYLEILKDWEVPNILKENSRLSKGQWKTIIKKEAKKQNEKLLKKMIEKGSKLEVMKNESYGKKAYLTEMSFYDARINFSLRARMFDCKMNSMNNPAYKSDLWRCDSCQSCIDSQSHILYCPAYKKLREGKKLSSDEDIVSYYREVLQIRMKLNLNKWGWNLVWVTANASLPLHCSWGRRCAEMKAFMFRCLLVTVWQFLSDQTSHDFWFEPVFVFICLYK